MLEESSLIRYIIYLIYSATFAACDVSIVTSGSDGERRLLSTTRKAYLLKPWNDMKGCPRSMSKIDMDLFKRQSCQFFIAACTCGGCLTRTLSGNGTDESIGFRTRLSQTHTTNCRPNDSCDSYCSAPVHVCFLLISQPE